MPNVRLRLKSTIVLLACLFSQNLTADKTYVYKEADGTVWYTNIVPDNQDRGRYQLLSVTGRATATKSCRGMTPLKLEDRAAAYEFTIRQIAQEYKVDAKLVKAVVRNESCFDRTAVSSAGAQGLMQLMPPTARELGVRDPFNPEQNLRGGIKYLGKLLNQYDNNIGFALAAYNAGPANVDRYQGLPPFKETQLYVERVMRSYRDYLREYLQYD